MEISEISTVIELILRWETVAIVTIIFMRKPLTLLSQRLVDGDSGKARIGPIELELGVLAKEGKEAIGHINEINYIVAKSRLLELEITTEQFSSTFSKEQRLGLFSIMKELEENIREFEKSISGNC